jgi:hypothetical protein
VKKNSGIFIPPKGEGVYCFTSVRLSFRPSKIFFVAFFSVTVDCRNLIFGDKHAGSLNSEIKDHWPRILDAKVTL